MAVNKKSNLLECIFISKKSLEISLNLTSQIKQLSLTHFVLIVTEPNLEARSFYSEYRGILIWSSEGAGGMAGMAFAIPIFGNYCTKHNLAANFALAIATPIFLCRRPP